MSQTTFGVTYWTNPSHTSRQHILEWGDMRLMDAMTKVLDILKPCFVGLAKLAKNFPTDPSTGGNSWAFQPLFDNSNIQLLSTGQGPTGGQRYPLQPKKFDLPVNTNLKVMDLFMSDGKKVTLETLQDRVQEQFPGYQLSENAHLRLIWLCPYICGIGEKYNGQKRIFSNTAPLLNRSPPLHTHPSIETLIEGIKKGSKQFLKKMNQTCDFLTPQHLESWKRRMEDPSITKDDLRRAYKMAQRNLFSGKQRDIILKLLTRKTLFNNQVPHIYGENLPEWFSSVHCTECLKRQVEIVETGTHTLKNCPSVQQLYAAVSQAFEVPDSSNTLAGFFQRPGPQNPIFSNNSECELTSIITWLTVIQFLSWRNTRDNFCVITLCNSIRKNLKVIWLANKGKAWDLGRYFDTPRPPESQ